MAVTEEHVEDTAAPGGARPHRSWVRRHPWRTGVAIGLAIVVVAVAVPLIGYAFRSHPKAKSVTSAVSAFRSGGSVTAPKGLEFRLPKAGVYSARGEGKASISFPPASEDDGAVMPVTVRVLESGCWVWRIDYNTARWHEYTYCPKGRELLLESQRNFQSWDFGTASVSNTGSYSCKPRSPIVVEDPKPGETFTHRCTGENSAAPGRSTTTGPARIVGPQTLRIGGIAVPTIHQTRHQVIAGPQHGELDEQWWFAADTGLPVKAERHYRLTSSSPIGDIDYREDGSWTLESMTPRT
jgi:hypothetical protein